MVGTSDSTVFRNRFYVMAAQWWYGSVFMKEKKMSLVAPDGNVNRIHVAGHSGTPLPSTAARQNLWTQHSAARRLRLPVYGCCSEIIYWSIWVVAGTNTLLLPRYGPYWACIGWLCSCHHYQGQSTSNSAWISLGSDQGFGRSGHCVLGHPVYMHVLVTHHM